MSGYKFFRNICSVLTSILIFMLFSCGTATTVTENMTEAKNAFKIYFVNNSEDKLVTEEYIAKGESAEERAGELIARLRSEPEKITLKKPIPDEIKINSWEINENILNIDFSETYRELTGISEILSRACVVKTLCQIEGVDKVEYTIDGQPLMYSELNPIGAMSGSDFIDNTGGETTYYQTVQLSLYYTDAEGKKLVNTRHNIEFDGTFSLEELVIRQLIDGPLEEENLAPVIPSGTKINKVSFKDGICYVDLSKEFLSGLDGVSDEVVVYSIVNSLAEVGSVAKVQLWIDGKTYGKYRETVPIDLPLERKLEIIETN